MNKLLFLIFPAFVLLLALEACQDYDSGYTDVRVETNRFNGSLLEYLSAGVPEAGVKFDSMLMLINGIPGMHDSLQKEGEIFTLFAVPDECFKNAFRDLNTLREVKNKGGALHMNDLLKEPFVVYDTIWRDSIGEFLDVYQVIAKINETQYDYRKVTDSLLCRYVFDGIYDGETIGLNSLGLDVESYKYRYRMNIDYQLLPASGVMDSGVPRVVFSDMNNSGLQSKWIQTTPRLLPTYVGNGIVYVLSESHSFGFNHFISSFQNYGNERKK